MKAARAVLIAVCTMLALADAGEPGATSPRTEANIPALLSELDSEEFDARESATATLIHLGERAESEVRKANQSPRSAEAKLRTTRILESIERTRLAKTALDLNMIYLQARKVCDEKADTKEFDPRIDRLLTDLNKLTPDAVFQAPVKIADCKLRKPEDGQMHSIYAGIDDLASMERSVAVVDLAANIAHADDSIILGWGIVEVGHATNCLIIAGGDVKVSYATNCTILSGGRLWCAYSNRSRFGGGDGVHYQRLGEGNYVVNAGKAKLPSRGAEATRVELPGLVLCKRPVMERVLDGKFQPTCFYEEFLLFKLPGDKVERVVRRGDELADNDGKPLAGLEGWRLITSGYSYATFRKGNERTYMRAPLHD